VATKKEREAIERLLDELETVDAWLDDTMFPRLSRATFRAARSNVRETFGFADDLFKSECLFPGQCLMAGEHLATECHTVEMLENSGEVDPRIRSYLVFCRDCKRIGEKQGTSEEIVRLERLGSVYYMSDDTCQYCLEDEELAVNVDQHL